MRECANELMWEWKGSTVLRLLKLLSGQVRSELSSSNVSRVTVAGCWHLAIVGYLVAVCVWPSPLGFRGSWDYRLDTAHRDYPCQPARQCCSGWNDSVGQAVKRDFWLLALPTACCAVHTCYCLSSLLLCPLPFALCPDIFLN